MRAPTDCATRNGHKIKFPNYNILPLIAHLLIESIQPTQYKNASSRHNHSFSLMAPIFHTTQNVATMRLIVSRKLNAITCRRESGGINARLCL